MLDNYNVDGKCVPLWEVDGKNGLATKVENAFLYANLEAPGAATAEADFKDDPPPPLTAQELEQQRRFREKHQDRTRQQGQSDRRHRVSRGSDFGAQAYPGRKSVMSGQRKPGNVVPLKTKIRRGIAWPELTQGGSPKKGSMMNTRKAIAELGLDVGYDVFLGTLHRPGLRHAGLCTTRFE